MLGCVRMFHRESQWEIRCESNSMLPGRHTHQRGMSIGTIKLHILKWMASISIDIFRADGDETVP